MAAKFDFDKFLERAGKVGSAFNNFQMERALLEEQRDRTSVDLGVYVPGPDDMAYQAAAAEQASQPDGIQIGNVTLQPLHLGIAGVALLLLLR